MLFNSRQTEQTKWQETEYLLRILFSRLNLLLLCPDARLDNYIRTFVRALRDGQSIHELQPLMKDISNRVNKLKGSALLAANVQEQPVETSDNGLSHVVDVFTNMLEKTNFPESHVDQIQGIKSILQDDQRVGQSRQLVSAVSEFTDMLDDIFTTTKNDRKKINKFLKQLNHNLRSMDEGIAESNALHSLKQELESAIDQKVTSEVHEMETMLSTESESEIVKESVMNSLQMIRGHMESFKEEEQKRNTRATALAAELKSKLDRMEEECDFLRKQVLDKQQQVLSDPLTGIRNRLAYEEAIQMECDRHNRYGRPLTLLVMDLDNFKDVNESFGHGSGDKVLQTTAKILAGHIRNVDFVARYGGEEFVIIFPELGMNDARQVGQKICKAVEAEKIDIGGQIIQVTISGGVAKMQDNDTPESLFEKADRALLMAKQRGRNRVEIE